MLEASESLHIQTLRSSLTSTGWLSAGILRYLQSYARYHVLNVLAKGIKKGRLSIIEDDGVVSEFGASAGICADTTVILTVLDPSVWTRILISNDLGVAEGYMRQDFDVSSLKDLLNLWLDNRQGLEGLENGFSRMCARYSAFAINALGRQNLATARLNVELAYNTSNNFFQTFLSQEMMYSCALWGEDESGVRGDLTVGPTPGNLEAAQARKIRLMLQKARLKPGDRLLEFGSGWGAMAIAAARFGCHVDTITLSTEQMVTTEKRAAAAGLSDKVRVHLCDYRDLPRAFEHVFDALITCEMIEAVGPRYMPQFFEVVDWALKKERAMVVITSTSCPEHRYTEYQADDFARHYHWPNSHIPSATALAVAVQNAVPGAFVLNGIEDHGRHYPRTLREWSRRFETNFTGSAVQELQDRYPQLCDEHELEAFKRKWRYMFVYAEVGFARAYATVNCWTFSRPENVAELCA